ncbi:MAG TPA: TadE family protein [Gammaproteobacteria bacterium]|nr:TadE family protein [Gammaproteobacteria bacterium]
MANRPFARLKRQAGEAGAATVELAVGLLVFLMLILGVVEFGYALFDWARVAEATRAGARTAIVSDPDTDLSSLYTGCDDPTPPAPVEAEPSDRVFATMQRIFPRLERDQVLVTYACSGTGAEERPRPILTVTVETQGVLHTLITPQLLGLDGTWTLPAFSSTRTSEDLAG